MMMADVGCRIKSALVLYAIRVRSRRRYFDFVSKLSGVWLEKADFPVSPGYAAEQLLVKDSLFGYF